MVGLNYNIICIYIRCLLKEKNMQNLDLKNKIALVTGGSNGIGAETVKMLASSGAIVLIGYFNGVDRANELIKSIPGNDHQIIRVKLESFENSSKIFQKIKTDYGKLDILVNSAGFTKPIPHKNINELNENLFDQILTANVLGPYSIIRALVPLLSLGKDSVVINVSSISAFTGSGSNIAYCASKGALDTMTMSLARAFGPKIRFLCVSPAAVATDFVEGRDRDALAVLAEKTPLQRIVEPQDVALSIMACITHLKTATGSKIIIDGGRHL
tara:strand:+ start:5612 stop:6424 length:813 start_codon:yes stop_codon:yes gene_type:complete